MTPNPSRPTITMSREQADQLFRDPPHRMLEVGPGQVAYRCVGQGPDVLFVHGWPASGATYRALLPYLAPHVTCHIVDLVGAGDSRFDRTTPVGLDLHIKAIRSVVDQLGLEHVAAVGHDSGGMLARHALAGDPRLRAMALVDTEQPQGLTARFRQFLAFTKLPGFGSILAWAAMRPGLRRSKYLLGDCFVDKSLLDGTFEEFFLAPLRDDPERRWATAQIARTFADHYVEALADLHAKIDVPVALVWGEDDPFFPLPWAKEMVDTFANAELHVVPRAKLFLHEEFPEAVAAAMLPTLTGTRP